LSRPEVEHLPKIFQDLGADFNERVLPSIGNEILKGVVVSYFLCNANALQSFSLMVKELMRSSN